MIVMRLLRGGGWPRRLARTGVLAVLPVAAVTAATWVAYTLEWRTDDLFAVVLVALVVLCVAAAVALAIEPLEMDLPRSVAAAVVAVYAGGALYGLATLSDRNEQVLHDRGVTAAAVVDRWWTVTSGETGNTQDNFYSVRPAGGGTLTFSAAAGIDRPRIGSTVTVTWDPRGEAAPRLGAVPPPPRGRVREAAFAVLCAGALVIGVRSASASSWTAAPAPA